MVKGVGGLGVKGVGWDCRGVDEGWWEDDGRGLCVDGLES